jgi:hypothetical protein
LPLKDLSTESTCAAPGFVEKAEDARGKLGHISESNSAASDLVGIPSQLIQSESRNPFMRLDQIFR